ncbi:MAG: hypothetical protein ACYDDF_10985 [Thermoplasmatota archaeon]
MTALAIVGPVWASPWGGGPPPVCAPFFVEAGPLTVYHDINCSNGVDLYGQVDLDVRAAETTARPARAAKGPVHGARLSFGNEVGIW